MSTAFNSSNIAKDNNLPEADLNNNQPNSNSLEESKINPDALFEDPSIAALTSLEDRIEPRILEDEMQRSYLRYAMSVIMSRALPDVRDGLKPVHRRILYTMHKLGLTPGSKYVKSARVVGEVLGKYHPHSDTAVYDALVRLAQDFNMRHPLVDGQGNYGSVDGDPAAAMRYTECRMAKPTPYLLSDLEKQTVDFVDNYDGSYQEPTVLPSIIPNLLINGSSGIAVGMATNIPPHNLQEVCEAALHLVANPEATIPELMEFVKGPDLPTGGTIYGKNDILNAYLTGRGRCLIQSETTVTEDTIIVSEIPYQVNKSNLIEKIAELVRDKRVEGIRDIRDESNKQGIRIVIECKRDASPEVILNQLFSLTDLQTSINFNLLALVNRGRQPKLLNLREILVEFVNHRYEVVTRRTNFELQKAQDELHILDGLKIALDHIDAVIKLIRASKDKAQAAISLQETFNLSQRQAEAILQMRLQTLTNLDSSKIEEERQQKIQLVKELLEILNNPERKKEVICGEIKEVITKFANPRRTRIVEANLSNYNKEDLIADEEVVVQLTNKQYIKVLPLDSFRTQGRGGRGVTSFNPKDEDWIKSSMVCNTHDYVYAFTNTGRVFRCRVFDLPNGSRIGRGQALINFFELQKDEKISNILTLSKAQEESESGYLIFATKNGVVKRTKTEEFNRINRSGKIAINLKEGDSLIGVCLTSDSKDQVILSANNGKTVIFNREKISSMGRTATGVRGIKLKTGFEVISLQISNLQLAEIENEDEDDALIEVEDTTTKVKEYPSILVITENGFGKQTALKDFRRTNRAASGVKTLKMSKKTGKPVLIQILYGNESNLIVTTKNGITIRLLPEQISQLSRSTQGVKIIRLEDGDTVVSGGVS